jgi:hypothetical protein
VLFSCFGADDRTKIIEQDHPRNQKPIIDSKPENYDKTNP